jgi:3-hydroxyisobutyrate dehydrogenase
MQHLLKDMTLFTSEAEKANLDTSLLQGLEAVIASTVNRGLADTDYSAVHDGVTEPEA